MRLSEIRGERAVEVIAELIEPVSTIAMDKNIADLLKIKIENDESAEQAAARCLKSKVPYLLKEHKKELVQVIGIIEGVDAEKLNILEITKCVFEIISDKTLIQLFSSAALTEEAVPQSGEFSK